VGGAIIALSDPLAEFAETALKAAPLVCLADGEFPEPGRVDAVPNDNGGLCKV
jgi:para-aminobenzoate synthetase